MSASRLTAEQRAQIEAAADACGPWPAHVVDEVLPLLDDLVAAPMRPGLALVTEAASSSPDAGIPAAGRPAGGELGAAETASPRHTNNTPADALPAKRASNRGA